MQMLARYPPRLFDLVVEFEAGSFLGACDGGDGGFADGGEDFGVGFGVGVGEYLGG